MIRKRSIFHSLVWRKKRAHGCVADAEVEKKAIAENSRGTWRGRWKVCRGLVQRREWRDKGGRRKEGRVVRVV